MTLVVIMDILELDQWNRRCLWSRCRLVYRLDGAQRFTGIEVGVELLSRKCFEVEAKSVGEADDRRSRKDAWNITLCQHILECAISNDPPLRHHQHTIHER